MPDHHDASSLPPESDPAARKPDDQPVPHAPNAEELSLDDDLVIDLGDEEPLDLAEASGNLNSDSHVLIPSALPLNEPAFGVVEEGEVVEEFELVDEEEPTNVPQAEEPLEGAVAFDLPSMDEEAGDVTRGVSREDLDFLMAEGVPVADPASFAGLPEAEAPLAVDAEAADIGEAVPMAESLSTTSGLIPNAEPVNENELPPVEREGNPVFESPLWSEPEAAVGSGVDLGQIDPVEAVQPASDWFHVPEATPDTPPAAVHDAPEAPVPAASEQADNRFEPVGSRPHEGSDIFAWKSPAEAASIPEAQNWEDTSVQVPPTATDPPEAVPLFEDEGELAATRPAAHLNVEEIDTGATPHASDDASSILGELSGSNPFMSLDGSEVRLEDPGVERTLTDEDALQDFELDSKWSPPADSDDLAIELVDDAATDDSAMRPDAPFGFADSPSGGEGSSVSISHEPEGAGGSGWPGTPGSDLFAERRSSTNRDSESGRVNPFDASLKGDQPSLGSAASSIFTGNSPPVGSGTPSSGAGSADVRIGRNEDEQTVFHNGLDEDDAASILSASDEIKLDPSLATGPLTSPNAGDEVDWLAASGGSEEVDFTLGDLADSPASAVFSKTNLPRPEGATSGIFSRGNLDPSTRPPEEERTQTMESAAGLFGEGTAAEGKKTGDKKSSKARPATPVANNGDDVEVDWLAGTDEPEAVKVPPVRSMPTAYAAVPDDDVPAVVMADDDESEERTAVRPRAERTKKKGSGLLVGGLAGLLAGVGMSAALYFAGLVPNAEEKPPVVAAKADPAKDAALAQLRKDLAAEKATAEQRAQDADREKVKASQEMARLNEDKIGLENLAKTAENDAKAAKAEADAAKLALTKADAAAKEALAKVAGLEKTVKEADEKAVTLDTAAKKAAEDLVKANKELDAAKLDATAQAKAATEAAEKLAKSETAVKQLTDSFGGIARDLQANKLLAADATEPAAIVAAVKEAATRASGPNVSSLVPAGPSALVGTGLTTGQLVDLSDRVRKSEANAKAAADKLASETAAIKTDYTAQIDAMKKVQADEAKKLTDAAAADLKKLKDDNAAAKKELSDKLAADRAKLKEEYEAKVLATQKKAAEDLAKAEATVAAMRADLANVITPAQSLDLWLPLLSEARRPTDVAAALANADKVLKDAAPGTEAHAKAQTVKGVALLIKGDDAGAKAAFAAAKRDGSFAADKPWAKIAEEGTVAVSDPVARFRKPVDPERKDPRASIRLLDDGIRFFTTRRYAEAEKTLMQSVAHDSTNPIGWYYLGAARWQLGKPDAAKEDFRQGAEREALRTLSARAVEQALAPIQGPARAALSDLRP